jgi:hypothetical protein
MTSPTPFFIGWSAEPPHAGRRRLLGAGLALAAGGAAGACVVLAGGRVAIGDGVWDMGRQRTLRGVVSSAPYPLLRTLDLGGSVRTVFLATDGKAAAPLPPPASGRWLSVTGTLITRGTHAMMAVETIEAARDGEPAGLHEVAPVDLGEVLLTGEILDAKCWFGAMRPGYGKAHKACAALCARGGLPLAFCRTDDCGTGTEAPLFVDAGGRAHTPAVLPWVADPVFVRGRLVRTGDVTQLRAGLADIRRL